MTRVIGLISGKQTITRELNLLYEAGFTENDIQVITLNREVEKLLGHKKYNIIANYAVWGAFIGGAIYTIFTLVAAWCNCNLLNFSLTISLEIVLVSIFVGGFIGGFLGLISGIGKYENEITPYTQGVRKGEKLIAVQVDEKEIEKAKQILQSCGTKRMITLDSN